MRNQTLTTKLLIFLQSDYYKPPKSETDLQKFAKGKLVDKWKNLKHELSEFNIEGEEENTDEVTEDVSEKLNELKLWLKNNSGPLDILEIKWKQTFSLRNQELLDKNISSDNFLSNWSLFKGAKGPYLVCIN